MQNKPMQHTTLANVDDIVRELQISWDDRRAELMREAHDRLTAAKTAHSRGECTLADVETARRAVIAQRQNIERALSDRDKTDRDVRHMRELRAIAVLDDVIR